MLDGFVQLAPRSFISAPLAARGEVLGVMLLATSEVSGRNFGPPDLELAEGLASRASLAIDNARLYGRAEAASKAKDHFLAALSHELRTPLTPVLMRVSALARSADLPEALRADLRMIQRNVELEAKLIDDLLDLTRVSRGKLTLHFEVTDVHCAARARGGDLLAKGARTGSSRSTSSPAPPSTTSRRTRRGCSRCSGTCSRTP